MKFTGEIDGSGRMPAAVRDDIAECLRRYRGKLVDVTIGPHKSNRSLDQNAYWWAVPVKILAEHCGYTDSQMHYALLGECFGFTPGPKGTPIPVKPSSSELTTDEFSRLIDWCLTWAASELGCVIPGPNEQVETSHATL